jgi:hypothetical protein
MVSNIETHNLAWDEIKNNLNTYSYFLVIIVIIMASQRARSHTNLLMSQIL